MVFKSTTRYGKRGLGPAHLCNIKQKSHQNLIKLAPWQSYANSQGLLGELKVCVWGGGAGLDKHMCFYNDIFLKYMYK